MNEVTRILSALEGGDPHAAEQLLPLVYDELRRLAAEKMAQEKPGQTLQATALVHEAYLRLVTPPRSAPSQGGDKSPSLPSKGAEAGVHWDSRGHFFAAAAEAMRRILVEAARGKGRRKHGGGRTREGDVSDLAAPQKPEWLLALDEALECLDSASPQAARLVKLRYFAGMTNVQAAASLGISPRKANQLWAYARAWLLEELEDRELE